MDKEVKKHMVGGYEFNTKEDAQLAKDELNAIKYVSAKTNTKDPKHDGDPCSVGCFRHRG